MFSNDEGLLRDQQQLINLLYMDKSYIYHTGYVSCLNEKKMKV